MKKIKALLVIDMQKGSFTEATPRFDTDGVVSRINGLAQRLRAENQPVIFIQHDGTTNNEYIPKTTEWELLDGLETRANPSPTPALPKRERIAGPL